MNIDQIPGYIRKGVVEYLMENCPSMTPEEGIKLASPREVFEMFCEWNGLVNWHSTLWNAVVALNEADLHPEPKMEV